MYCGKNNLLPYFFMLQNRYVTESTCKIAVFASDIISHKMLSDLSEIWIFLFILTIYMLDTNGNQGEDNKIK